MQEKNLWAAKELQKALAKGFFGTVTFKVEDGKIVLCRTETVSMPPKK